MPLSDDEIKVSEDFKVLVNFKLDSPSNNPRFQNKEMIFTNINTDIQESLMLIVLVKIGKRRDEDQEEGEAKPFDFQQKGFNLVPIFRGGSSVLNGNFAIPLISQKLDSSLFEFISAENPWRLQDTLLQGESFYSGIFVEYKQYSPELKVNTFYCHLHLLRLFVLSCACISPVEDYF